MEEKKESFTYTYSAPRQEELRHLREKYAPPTEEEEKMERLRRLDRSVTKPGSIASLALGSVSTLVMGFGMCCTMVWTETLFVPGIVIGMLGMTGVCAAYPLYVRITKKKREKIAPEIMRLTNELMK